MTKLLCHATISSNPLGRHICGLQCTIVAGFEEKRQWKAPTVQLFFSFKVRDPPENANKSSALSDAGSVRNNHIGSYPLQVVAHSTTSFLFAFGGNRFVKCAYSGAAI